LCLIATQPQNGLNLFQEDLYRFSAEIQTFLSNPSQREGKDVFAQISELLPHWYDNCVNYISRAIRLLGRDNLAVLIHEALIGKKIVVKPNRHASDVVRFIRLLQRQDTRAVSYAEIASDVSPNEPKQKLDDNTVHVTFTEGQEPQKSTGNGQVVVNTKDTNQFCLYWAEKLYHTLTHPDSPSAFQIHSEIVGLKNQVFNQLKSIHQRISDARSDYYALYRAYQELKENPNQDMLLEKLLQEVSNSNNVQMIEVLQAIYNFNSKLAHMND